MSETDNPVAADGEKPAAETTEAETAEAGHDAVLSLHASDYLLTKLWRALALKGGMGLVWLMRALSLALAVTILTYHEGSKTELAWIFDVTMAVGISLWVLPYSAIVSMRSVVADGGQLDALGAGTAKISKASALRLKIAHALLCVLSVIFVLLGLLCLVTATRVGTKSKLTGREITATYAVVVFLFGFQFILHNTCIMAWWHTKISATILASDKIKEVQDDIERVDLDSAEWGAVARKTLSLVNETLPALSSGWGNTLGLTFVMFWLFTVGTMAALLDTDHTITVGSAAFALTCFVIVMVSVPLLMSQDLAAASSGAKRLVDTLNNKRMAACDAAWEEAADAEEGEKFTAAMAVDSKLRILETSLDRLNRRQGPGFMVAGKVVDKDTLHSIYAALVTLATTVLPLVYALRPADWVPSAGSA